MGWFCLSWIIIISAISVSCQELTTLLPQDGDACMRSEVTFTCTVRGSRNLTTLILAWSSDEYIGNGKVFRFLSTNTPGTNFTSMINENVTAILTNKTNIGGVPILVSELHIVGANQRSMITCESVTNESSANTVISISALPGQPKNVVARQLSPSNCDFLVTWDPPTNIDRFDIDRYMIYVPLRNMAKVEVSTTTVLNISDCRDSSIRIEVSALNNFGCEGLNSTEIQPSLLEMPTIPTVNVDTQHSATIAGGVVGGFLLLIIIVIVIVMIIFGIFACIRVRADQKGDKYQLHTRWQDDLQRDLEYLLAALKFESSPAIKEYVHRLKETMEKTPSSYIKEALVRALDKIKWEKNGQYVRKALVNLTKLIPKIKPIFDEKLKGAHAITPSGKAWTMDELIETLRRGGFQTVFDTLISEVDTAEPDSVKKLLQDMCHQLEEAISKPVNPDQSEVKETNVDTKLRDEVGRGEHQEAFDTLIEKVSLEQAKELLLEIINKLQEKVAMEASDGGISLRRNTSDQSGGH